MKLLDENVTKQISGGFAASTALVVSSCIFAGVSLVSNVISGALNIASASARKKANEPLQYSNFDEYINTTRFIQ